MGKMNDTGCVVQYLGYDKDRIEMLDEIACELQEQQEVFYGKDEEKEHVAPKGDDTPTPPQKQKRKLEEPGYQNTKVSNQSILSRFLK